MRISTWQVHAGTSWNHQDQTLPWPKIKNCTYVCFHLLVLNLFSQQVRSWFCLLCSEGSANWDLFKKKKRGERLYVHQAFRNNKPFKRVISHCFRRWGGHRGSRSVKLGGCTSFAGWEKVAGVGKWCCLQICHYHTARHSGGKQHCSCQPAPVCLRVTRNGGVQRYLTFYFQARLFFALNMIQSKRGFKSFITFGLW